MKSLKTYKVILALIAISLFAFSFTSCNDDDNDNGPVYLPSKITDRNGIKTYTYDSQNRLTHFNFETSSATYSSILTYTDNKITKVVLSYSHIYPDGQPQTTATTYIYEYKQDSIIEIREDDSYIIQKFVLDSQSRLKRKINSSATFDYTYDATGNVSHIVNPGYSDEYTYDNRNGIFRNDQTPQWNKVNNQDFYAWDYHIMNNTTKFRRFEIGSNNLEMEISYTITYNEDGYPIKITSDREDDVPTTIEYIKR